MKVAIIGGAGKMGRWFAKLLLQEGKEVVISGRDQKKLAEAGRQLGVKVASNVDAVKAADAVILSVSIESFESVVAEISPYVKPGQIVVDVTSIKTMPVAAMHKHLENTTVLGTHPLFGPGARSLANQNFILTPTNQAESALAQKVKKFLEDREARVSLMTPQEHDEMMTIILGLSHFIAIVAADTLLSSGKMKPPAAVGGVTYKVLLTLIESVVSENPELYASLQMNLPGITGVEKLFQDKAKDWAGLVSGKDREQFVRRMKQLKESLEGSCPDFGKAYENMYKITDGLK